MINRALNVLLVATLISGCSAGDRTRELADRNDVMTTVNRLFIDTDNRDWPAVRACFADSVLFDMTSMTGGQPVRLSPHQITDAWDRGLKPLKALHHQVGNHIITTTGEEATAFCYGTATHYLPTEGAGSTRTFVGSYDFHLRRAGQAWVIDAFKFTLKFMEGNPHLGASPSSAQ